MQTANAPVQQLTDEAILALAHKAARAAGRVQLECRQHTLTVDRTFAHDIKLEADRLSEEAIFRTISDDMPDAAFMAEESGEIAGDGGYVWIIDPLDGTMNYYHGQHHFCTCVACYSRPAESADTGIDSLGTPVAGVVYAPSYDEMFSGRPDESATCNGQKILASPVDKLEDSLVATSFGSKPEVMARMEGIVHELIHRTRKVRLQGCCGLDICNVAAGKLSALYQSDIRSWDFAAARVILENAGGKIKIWNTGPNRWNVLAAAPGIFSELLELVESR